MQGWFSIFLFIVLGAAFALVAVFLSSLLGPRKPTPEKSAPYECGMPPVGNARERMSVKFYLVAMIFIVFDIEIVDVRAATPEELAHGHAHGPGGAHDHT